MAKPRTFPEILGKIVPNYLVWVLIHGACGS